MSKSEFLTFDEMLKAVDHANKIKVHAIFTRRDWSDMRHIWFHPEPWSKKARKLNEGLNKLNDCRVNLRDQTITAIKYDPTPEDKAADDWRQITFEEYSELEHKWKDWA